MGLLVFLLLHTLLSSGKVISMDKLGTGKQMCASCWKGGGISIIKGEKDAGVY